MLHPDKRRKNMTAIIATHCIYCGKEAMVSFRKATDFVCNDCKDLLKRLPDPEHIMQALLDESI